MTHNYIYNLIKHIAKTIDKSYSKKSIDCVLEYKKSKKRLDKTENFIRLFNKKELQKVKHFDGMSIEQIVFKSFDTVLVKMQEHQVYIVEVPSANAKLKIEIDDDNYTNEVTYENVELVVSGKTIPIFSWAKQEFNIALIENKLFGIKKHHYEKLLNEIVHKIDYVYDRFEKIQLKKHQQHEQRKLNSSKFDDVKQSIKSALKRQK